MWFYLFLKKLSYFFIFKRLLWYQSLEKKDLLLRELVIIFV